MKETGVVRRIDDLGRVVIPKEIRKTLKIREGDSLEIYVLENGCIALKKFSPLGDLSALAKLYAKATLKQADKCVIITDTEKVIAASKTLEKIIENQKITKELEKIIEGKEAKTIKEEGFKITNDFSFQGQVHIEPILVYGDIMGAVILLDENEIKEEYKTLAKIGSSFFGEYISS